MIIWFLKLIIISHSSITLKVSLRLLFLIYHLRKVLVVSLVAAEYGVPESEERRKVANIVWVVEFVVGRRRRERNQPVRAPRQLVTTMTIYGFAGPHEAEH